MNFQFRMNVALAYNTPVNDSFNFVNKKLLI